jgi:hypothetical protein
MHTCISKKIETDTCWYTGLHPAAAAPPLPHRRLHLRARHHQARHLQALHHPAAVPPVLAQVRLRQAAPAARREYIHQMQIRRYIYTHTKAHAIDVCMCIYILSPHAYVGIHIHTYIHKYTQQIYECTPIYTMNAHAIRQ